MTTAPACLVFLVSAWSQIAPASTCDFAGETKKTKKTNFLKELKGLQKNAFESPQTKNRVRAYRVIRWSHWSFGLTSHNARFSGRLARPSRDQKTTRDQMQGGAV